MTKGYIHSIETMGLVDGPGIRTVFFLQGCPLKCAYCHNPDTQAPCKTGTIITAEEMVSLAKRYVPYYRKSGGGVTISGGEPLMQGEFLVEALKGFKKENICTTLDTSGFGPTKYMEEVIRNVSYVMLDIKHFDEAEHISLTGSSMKGREFFMQLLKKYNTRLLIRHVMVPGYTDSFDAMDSLYESVKFLSKTIEKIEILPYHRHGVDKYTQLGMDYKLEGVPEMDEDQAAVYMDYINKRLETDRQEMKIREA